MTPTEAERIAAILDKLKRQTVADNIVYGPAYAEAAAAIAEVVAEAEERGKLITIAQFCEQNNGETWLSKRALEAAPRDNFGINSYVDPETQATVFYLEKPLRKPDGGEGQTDV